MAKMKFFIIFGRGNQMVNEIEFKQDETTEIFTEVYLKKGCNIYLECIKHETTLKFRIFLSLY